MLKTIRLQKIIVPLQQYYSLCPTQNAAMALGVVDHLVFK